jgi:hypothetical protein
MAQRPFPEREARHSTLCIEQGIDWVATRADDKRVSDRRERIARTSHDLNASDGRDEQASIRGASSIGRPATSACNNPRVRHKAFARNTLSVSMWSAEWFLYKLPLRNLVTRPGVIAVSVRLFRTLTYIKTEGELGT